MKATRRFGPMLMGAFLYFAVQYGSVEDIRSAAAVTVGLTAWGLGYMAASLDALQERIQRLEDKARTKCASLGY